MEVKPRIGQRETIWINESKTKDRAGEKGLDQWN